MSIRFHKQDGFTLVELLAAMTILGIVLIAFIPFFSQHANFVRITEDELTAINLADKVAQEMKENADSSFFVQASCDNPSEIESNHTEMINNKNYYVKIEVCQQDDVTSLYQAKIEIYTDSSNQKWRLLTHVYTYFTDDKGAA
ncbi:type II secretion system protein [Aquibacillus sediminis]|uniref:type II secretion system protein n=1 Tax=Aquibacillus sediminis TaxID=2574734 RepID=UPI001108294D|nr:type II secretion system protein [Aquibacillus sediminis]